MPTLNFKGKAVIETYHHTVPHHRLEFDENLSLLPKGQKPALDGNLIIEGDNLLALKALLPTHAGKIKCVYIDPPYNTGEEAWVYNDNLTQPQFKEWIGKTVGKEGEDATRHDKWCCMMYPRLRLLWELLEDRGILLVSIDDNEAASLRLMLDEIFRTLRPLATFVWKRRSPTGMRGDPISVDHEYVYAYAKNPAKVELTGLIMTEDDFPYQDAVSRYASTDLTIGMTKEDRPNQYYPIKNPKRGGKEYPPNPDRVWRFEPGEMKRVIADGLVIWPDDNPDKKMTRPRFKTRFDPNEPKIKPVSSWIQSKSEGGDEDDESDIRSVTSGLNAEGGRVLAKIFGEKVFSYPKPPSLIRSLVKLATGARDIVLDSFAGSGTTGQAVLEVNADDGKDRRFVLVQLPHDTSKQQDEKFNVCEQVTQPRVKAVMAGYKCQGNGNTQCVKGLGGSFVYATVGDPLFGEYRDLGDKLPKFEEIAKYIFYTETSRECDLKKINEKTGFIGSTDAAGGTSYYLFYTPNQKEDCELSTETLKTLLKKDKNRMWVVYCEKIWLHGDQLRAFEKENGRRIRPMLVPFSLK